MGKTKEQSAEEMKSSISTTTSLIGGIAYTKQVSLNNIPEGDLKEMINEFESKIYNKLIPKKGISYWFSREVLSEMRNLLVKEQQGKPTSEEQVTDGFRIYFIAKGSDKKHLSIAVVSTKNDGPEGSDPKIIHHKDYYEHDGSHRLFTLTDVSGNEGKGDCGGGAKLYTRCNDCQDDDCQVAPRHRVTRKYAETMVADFGNNKINTKCIWFDFSLLHELIESGIDFDGIRIYYGNYGKTGATGKSVEEYADQDTCILMLTESTENTKVHKDMFGCEMKQKLRLDLHSLYNNGQLCPTHCNTRP
jgi:hypothetical protein